MNKRELAREYFKEHNLSYDDIDMNDLYELIKLLNKQIIEADSCMIMINEPKLKGNNKNIIFTKDGKLAFAELRVKGTYFESREAITFNNDGFIGISGWADGRNLTPFVDAFIKWCDYLYTKKKEVDVNE